MDIERLSQRYKNEVGEAAATRRTGRAPSEVARPSDADRPRGDSLEVSARARELAKDRQELLQVNLQGLLSKAQDTDMADAISKFPIQETLYKASLEAASKAIQPSLLDYLR